MTGRCAAIVAVLLVLAAPRASAHEGAIDNALAALAKAPVYVDPAARPAIADAQALELAARIRAGTSPVYVAVIDEQDAPGHEVVHELVTGLGREGTYIVVAAGEFGIHSTEFDHETAERLQAGADAEPKDELAATLDTLVAEAQREAAPLEEDEDETPWALVALALLGITLVAAVTTAWALRRGRRPAPDLPQGPPPA